MKELLSIGAIGEIIHLVSNITYVLKSNTDFRIRRSHYRTGIDTVVVLEH